MSTFNISTTVAFVVAAAGVPVFKHGNRSITSKCGSADLLEALGIVLDAPHEVLRESLDELNFCFFLHLRSILRSRKSCRSVRRWQARGKRSIFNLLGPLINPGKPAHQLLGVFAQEWVQPLGAALDSIGLSAGMVVHGVPEPVRALDELSCAGENFVAGFGRLGGIPDRLTAIDAGLGACSFADLAGGDVEDNLRILDALVSGAAAEVPQGLRDTVLLNAGAALWPPARQICVRGSSPLTVLKDGAVADWLLRVKTFYSKVC